MSKRGKYRSSGNEQVVIKGFAIVYAPTYEGEGDRFFGVMGERSVQANDLPPGLARQIHLFLLQKEQGGLDRIHMNEVTSDPS